MKKKLVLLVAIASTGLLGCMPNLRPTKVSPNFYQDSIKIVVSNTGLKRAGEQLTYIEINEIGAPDSAKPQCQYSAKVPPINGWGSWDSGIIRFQDFSCRPGIDLMTLRRANVVVRVDAKDMVKESNENDNVYNANH
jgi:hypothetical protein